MSMPIRIQWFDDQKLQVKFYSISKIAMYTVYIFVYFLADQNVLATPLLLSPVLYFWDFWIRNQRAAVASRRATNLNILYLSLCLHKWRPSYNYKFIQFYFSICLWLIFSQLDLNQADPDPQHWLKTENAWFLVSTYFMIYNWNQSTAVWCRARQYSFAGTYT